MKTHAAFRFPDEVRPFVNSLAKLLYYANGRKEYGWAAQVGTWTGSDSPYRPADNGVYGHTHHTISAIVYQECREVGADWAKYFDHDDFTAAGIEAAITDALNDQE